MNRKYPRQTLFRSETRSRAVSCGLLLEQWRGCDYFRVLSSLVYCLVRCLVGLLAEFSGRRHDRVLRADHVAGLMLSAQGMLQIHWLKPWPVIRRWR
jgi:hypothetical protein